MRAMVIVAVVAAVGLASCGPVADPAAELELRVHALERRELRAAREREQLAAALCEASRQRLHMAEQINRILRLFVDLLHDEQTHAGPPVALPPVADDAGTS